MQLIPLYSNDVPDRDKLALREARYIEEEKAEWNKLHRNDNGGNISRPFIFTISHESCQYLNNLAKAVEEERKAAELPIGVYRVGGL